MKNLKEVTKKLISQYVDPSYPEDFGWPPTCSAVLYQPERPVMIKAETQDSVSRKD